LSNSRFGWGPGTDRATVRVAKYRSLDYLALVGLGLGSAGCFFGTGAPGTTISNEGVLEGTFTEVERRDADGFVMVADPSGVLTFLAPAGWEARSVEDTVAKLVEVTASPNPDEFASDAAVGAIPGALVAALRGAPSTEGFVSDVTQLAAGLRVPEACDVDIPPPPLAETEAVVSLGAAGICPEAGTAVFTGAAGWDGEDTAIYLTAAIVVDADDPALAEEIFVSIAVGGTTILGEAVS